VVRQRNEPPVPAANWQAAFHAFSMIGQIALSFGVLLCPGQGQWLGSKTPEWPCTGSQVGLQVFAKSARKTIKLGPMQMAWAGRLI
jgi:hypothetical protein